MKSTLKKFLSITLVVSMLMSMCTFAFAAGTGSKYSGDYEQIVSNGEERTTQDGAVKQSKLIRRTGDDTFDITLTVKTLEDVSEVSTSPDAAVVIVFDASGSMDGYIRQARDAAKSFVESFAPANLPQGVQRKVAVVTFANDGNTVLGWTDAATKLSEVTSVFNNGNRHVEPTIKANGGTNLEAGMRLASNLLDSNDIKDIANRYVVILTDGVPTYHVDDNNTTASTTYMKGSKGGGDEAKWDDYKDITSIANTIKGSGKNAQIYSIRYNLNSNEKVGNQNVANFLGGFSTQCVGADTSTITNKLKAIAQTISLQAQAWIVTDPMGQFIVDFDMDEDGYAKGTTAQLAGSTNILQFNTETNTLQWDLKNDRVHHSKEQDNSGRTWHVYTLTYSVKLDTENRDFVNDQAYPTNGTTSLSYVIIDSTGETDTTLKTTEFKVPEVQGKAPAYTYTINYLVKDKEGNFQTLDSETKTVPMWTVVSAEEGYANKYSQLTQNGFFGFYKFASVDKQDATMTITEDDMVMNLRYVPVLTSATVNHNYITIYTKDGEYQRHSDPVQKPEVTTSLPVGEEFSAKKAENDGYTFAETKEIGEVTFTSDDLTITALDASGDNNVINLYYFKTVDTKTDVPYTVQHTYTDKTWKLENGTWESKTTTKTPENLIESHTGKHGEIVTGTPNANSVDVDKYEVTSTDHSITLDKNGKNVIEITYYRETGKPDETTWVVNRYYKTITASGTNASVESTKEVLGTEENGCVFPGYVGETKSVNEDQYKTYEGKTYNPTEGNITDLKELKADASQNVINLYYERDEREEVTVIVNHTRYTYKDVLNEETGLMEKTQVGEPDTSGSGTVSAPNGGKWYKGMTFSAKQDAKGYNFVSADPEVYENITLNGNTEINFVYETYTPNGKADVTVYHNYRTYRTYVNDAGEVVRDELVLPVDAVKGNVVEGKVGERYQFEEVSRDGFVPDNGNAAKLTGELVGKDGRVDLYYNAYVYPETTTVTVVRHYGTYTKSIDEETGKEVKSEWVKSETECATTYPQTGESTVWYPGQTYTANPNNYSDYTGYSYDTVKTTANSCKLVADGEKNVIDLYYFNEATNFVPVTVIVKDHYTDTIHYIENGEAKTRVETDTYTREPVTTKRMNEFYKADSNSNGFVAADTNVYEIQLAATGVTVTIDNKEYQNVNYIDLYYTRENSLKDAKVKVNHYYEVYSMQTGELIESSENTSMPWSTGWKENQYYTPTPEALGYELYKGTNTSNNTWVTGEGFDGKYTMQLAAGENVINLFYRYAKDTRVDATVTVYHVYKVYDDYTKKFVETDKVPTKDADVIFGRDNGAYVGNEFDASRYAAPVDDQEFGKFAVEEYQEQKTFVIGENGNEVTIIYVKHIDTTPIYDDDPPARPKPPVTPPEDIDEPDVPLAGDPEIEDLGDGDVPLAGAPDDEFEDLEEEEVPLAAVPKTSDMALFWLASSALSGIGLGALNLKKREDEDEQ